MISNKDPFARFVKRQDYIDYTNQKVFPQAFMLRTRRNGKMEEGISVISLKNFPGDFWKIAQEKIGNPGKPVWGYAKLTETQITSCEIPLFLNSAPSKNIPNHYEIRPLLEKLDKIKIANQLAEKADLVFAPCEY